MQFILLGLATAITLLTFITHITIGTKQNAAPILEDVSLPAQPRNTLIFSWHANSALLFAMTLAFSTGFFVESTMLVLYNGLLAAGLAVSALTVTLQASINPIRFPPFPLFVCIAVLGIASTSF